MIFYVIGIVGISMVIMTGLLAWLFTSMDAAVANNKVVIEQQKERFKPEQTMGFEITQNQDQTARFLDARKEAAKRAASLPRGGNVGIGRKGAEQLKTASKDLANDPISAFKIAEQQGWNGMGDFSAMQEAALGGAVVAQTVVKRVRRKLVPGKDYPITPITDTMSLAEKRKTRVANAKNKYVAMEKLKASGDLYTDDAPVIEQTAGAPAAAAPAAVAAPNPAAAAGIAPPDLIEITDGMSKDERRTAKIANSKAKSAYKKALKAAGIDPKSVDATPAPVAAPAPAPAAAPAAEAAPAAPAIPSDIPAPDLIEITDDMSKDEKRSAKIANSKAKSAYKKALKAAGIDPKSVKI